LPEIENLIPKLDSEPESSSSQPGTISWAIERANITLAEIRRHLPKDMLPEDE